MRHEISPRTEHSYLKILLAGLLTLQSSLKLKLVFCGLFILGNKYIYINKVNGKCLLCLVFRNFLNSYAIISIL